MTVHADIAKNRREIERLKRRVEFHLDGKYIIWGDPADDGAVRVGRINNEFGIWVKESGTFVFKTSFG